MFRYFLATSDTVPSGLGFSHFDKVHLCWLAFFVLTAILNCLLYRKLSRQGRIIWRKTVAVLLIADEVFKTVVLLACKDYQWGDLPLHLCSINIFLIAIHAWKPGMLLDNFLYTICFPGAMAALLFPTWTNLPVLNAIHLHSATVHILLALYPITLFAGGDIRPSLRMLPKCLGLLAVMAVPIYGINLLLGTNFMFLMSAGKGNPLYLFEQIWGNHLFGFPVIIAGVLIIMFLPLEMIRNMKKDK